MIKLTFCLMRRPELSRAQFQDYWFNTHGPLVASVKDVLRIRRYVQLHSLPEDRASGDIAGARGAPEPYDGVAQLWWDSFEDISANRHPNAAEAGRMLLEDEKKFIDHSRSPLWWGEEKVIIG